MGQLASKLFFYKNSLSIKYLTKVDMQLNKETKTEIVEVAIFHFLCPLAIFHFLCLIPGSWWTKQTSQSI